MEPTRYMLVAEDNSDDVLLLNRAFAKAGFSDGIHFVHDGLEGKEYLLAALRTETWPRPLPKVLLLDLKMPRMDGFELLEWVRGGAGLHCLPVVVFSSSNEQQDVNRAYALGANSYVVKPSEPAQLDEFVRLLHGYWAEWNQPTESGIICPSNPPEE